MSGTSAAAVASCLALDANAECRRIEEGIRDIVVRRLHRRGAIVGVSGGVDSAVCLALSTRALGAERVLALLMPERESSDSSSRLGEAAARSVGAPFLVEDLTAALAGIACYDRRDRAIRNVFPDYGPGWKNKIVLGGGQDGQFHHFRLVVRDPFGVEHTARLPHREYLEIVAAQNFKQRLRKATEYHHADRLNYAVVGTPNLLEYDQGFFVKNGDGSADLKPIAHLYKTQVYALARHLGLPEEICTSSPTTDTYTLAQGQDEFFFGLPYPQMDLALWSLDRGDSPEVLAARLGLGSVEAAHIYEAIVAKRQAVRYLQSPPLGLRYAP